MTIALCQSLGIHSLVGNEVGPEDPGLSDGPESYPSPQNYRLSEIEIYPNSLPVAPQMPPKFMFRYHGLCE